MVNGLFEGDVERVFKEYELAKDERVGVKIIFATYSYEDYEGFSYVLFEKEGKLYEVNGSHCSCHGLEGQWQPEEVEEQYLTHKLENGRFSYDNDKDKLMKEAIGAALIGRIFEREVLKT